MSSAKTTTDHKKIRQWVEERGGHPAVVRATENGRGGLLRIDYDDPDGSTDSRLDRIDWSEFFEIFDKGDIAFLYDPDSDSRFSKFVANETAES